MLRSIGRLRAMRMLWRSAIAGAVSLGVLAVAVSSSPNVADAHSHKNPDGTTTSWYPMECCHDGDCRPVSRIVRAPHGLWLTTVDNQTVLIGPNDRRLPSRDMRWHVCINHDIETVPDTVRCVFEPPDS